MRKFFADDSLILFTLELDRWEYPLHNHNFYELILIEKGEGKHTVNDITFKYAAGDIFLLSPNDAHEFFIEETTTFNFLKFTESLFLEKQHDNPTIQWKEIVEQALSRPNVDPGDIIACKKDRQQLHDLYKILQAEFNRPSCMFSRQAQLDIFGAMMSILARNLNQKNICPASSEEVRPDKITYILAYIRKHIDDPEKIRVDNIAKEFLVSSNYLGPFIKKHTGMSLQQMVITTKVTIAKRLIAQSELTLSQIAFQLGFTDASHFNKIFKKYTDKNPKEFRKEFRLSANKQYYLS